MIADYDKSQPKYVPIILSIIITIIVILGLTVGIIYYFKSSLSIQNRLNEDKYGYSIELEKLRNWENDYLNSTNNKKVNIDEAIYIISNSNN